MHIDCNTHQGAWNLMKVVLAGSLGVRVRLGKLGAGRTRHALVCMCAARDRCRATNTVPRFSELLRWTNLLALEKVNSHWRLKSTSKV
eukprot:3932002-Rhodomonas_salina.2